MANSGSVSGSLDIRCPRNSKNNDGSNCYCNNYSHPLYHGIASKSVICCYADGECCYQKTCRYSHIKANSLMMPCIFELNGRRCNNPKKCIFSLSYHKNRCIPRKSEQVYRYDIKHNQTKSRFPRSKRVIDSDFDNNPLLINNNNNNSSNIPVKTVYVAVPAPIDNHINHHHHNNKRIVGNNGNMFVKGGGGGGHASHTAHHGCKRHAEITAKSTNMSRNANLARGNFRNNNFINKEDDNKYEDEKEMDIDELDKFENEIEKDIIYEIARTKEQYKEKGLSMPFSEKIRIKQRVREKYNNMQKQMNDNKQFKINNKNKDIKEEKSNEKINKVNMVTDTDLIDDFAKIEIPNTIEAWEAAYQRGEISISCDDDDDDQKGSFDNVLYDFGNIDTDC